MKKILYIFITTLLIINPLKGFSSPPGEGMWLPHLLKAMNESEMKAMGLKLSAEDIYSVNKTSLKDAIISFGGFCTGSVISDQGLIITNHHCGYRQIQQHSTVENDYLTDGFWAMDKSEELANPGLTATFIIRIEDVTDVVLDGITNSTPEAERAATIRSRSEQIASKAVEGTHYEAFIRPFYYGNEYYMFVVETFRDIRMVGAPPSAIGKYGGDTDNWMWPRHTGDFSIFRIYAGPDNKPAEYSPDNVPFKPRHSLPVNIKGVDKGDFTMVFGFPGRTEEYLSSHAVEDIYERSNPRKIAVRAKKLDVIGRAMNKSDELRIKYAAKQSSVSNYHKKWIGENKGLKKLRAIKAKRASEAAFIKWVDQSEERHDLYGSILPDLKKEYEAMVDIQRNMDYMNEAALGIDIVRHAYRFRGMVEEANGDADEEKLKRIASQVLARSESHFKDYDIETDKEMMTAMLKVYNEGVPKKDQPAYFREQMEKYDGDYAKMTESLFKKTVFKSPDDLHPLLEDLKAKKIARLSKDPAFKLMEAFIGQYFNEIRGQYFSHMDEIDRLMRIYIQGLREMKPNKKFYPDANSTLRLTYGKVDDYVPYDGAFYKHFTTIDGIIEKHNPDDKDFVLPQKFLDLYKAKDFGRYERDGTVRVCFTASNHTSGGNSGSPVIDGEGRLIGVNFDRNWEGTMSDIMYDPDRCRNISVDISYVLFVVDKYAGAGHLVKEMKVVK